MDEKKCIAFIDLLGFSHYTSINPKGALKLLENYQNIISTKIIDSKIAPASSYKDKRLERLASQCGIDSFEYLLPFSDNIFITSKNANIFLKQISCFLLDCFLDTSQTFNSEKSADEITKVSTKSFIYNESKEIFPVVEEENWYPVLFRGGITFDEVIPIQMNAALNYNTQKITNLFGKGIVKAVGLEKTSKGPRLFCDKNFVDQLSNDVKHFVIPLLKDNISEILWPMIIYNDDTDCDIEINNFMDLFKPAVNLWKAFNHLEFAMHYYKFLKIITKSTLHYFKYRGCLPLAESYICQKIKDYDLPLKKEDLMNSDFI